jgi:hypothetical protein
MGANEWRLLCKRGLPVNVDIMVAPRRVAQYAYQNS